MTPSPHKIESPDTPGRFTYKHFDAREDGWTKVVLNPGQTT
jgi:hypothetical protein